MLNFFFDYFTHFTFGYFNIVSNLQVEPEFRFNFKIFTETQRGISSNLFFAMCDLTNSICRDINVFCQLILSNLRWSQKFFQ